MIVLNVQSAETMETIGPFLSSSAAKKFYIKTYSGCNYWINKVKDKKEVFNEKRRTLAQRLEDAPL